jgi:flagellar biosynthetic protein FlhB
MADAEEGGSEKSLEPTERRLEKAREEGQFPQSRDLTSFVLLALFILFIAIAGGMLVDRMVIMLKQSLQFPLPEQLMDFLAEWATDSLLGVFGITAVAVLMSWLISIFGPLAIAGFRPVFVFKFDPSRIDPIAGIGRIVSLNTLTELIKSIVKAALVLGVGGFYLVALVGNVRSLVRMNFEDALNSSAQLLLSGAGLLLLPMVLIATADGFLQWFQFRHKMRMTQQEVKEEMKESDGAPEIRQRIRQRQRQLATGRMMAAVTKADVVLANPEHYSIALRYDENSMAAPMVVAKGMDQVALALRERAAAHGVPIARSPALARLMYAQLEIGMPVPEQLFEAVAKILAWAYEVRDGSRGEMDLPDVGELPEMGRQPGQRPT